MPKQQREPFQDPYLPEGGLKGRGSNRYRDTSWQIHHQWRFKQNATFPSVEAGCQSDENLKIVGGSAPTSPTPQSSTNRCNGSVPVSPVTIRNEGKPVRKTKRSESVPATPVFKNNETVNPDKSSVKNAENKDSTPTSQSVSRYNDNEPVKDVDKDSIPASPISAYEYNDNLSITDYNEKISRKDSIPASPAVSRYEYNDGVLNTDVDSIPATPVSRRDYRDNNSTDFSESIPVTPVSRTSSVQSPRAYRNALFLDEDMSPQFDDDDDLDSRPQEENNNV
ncbi:hypothetical protein B566_EDAN012952, partial [Ephemera danica]